ncbi:MAG: pyridoxal-phosphate dependent enzyme [Deltaproteobacteria bacterium]|nr:pyridoxal-phosphate dependent enzyme [Deltaproteobacteria bacterium]
MATRPTIRDIREAAKRIQPWVHQTPVLTSSTLNDLCDAEIFFKCENFQRGGAFKIRGATNAVFSLEEEEAGKGVATHSSGNHAAALALAAGWRGIKAHVVMPENAPRVKKEAVAGYGAEITFCEPTLRGRETALAQVVNRTGARFIHPYNDTMVISGQGTAALELCEKVPDLDVVIVPVGGGGLLSGTAIAVSGATAAIPVFGAEPENADDAYRSLKAGKIIPSENPDTIADGLLTSLGDLTFPIIQALVRDIVRVSEEDILRAMRLIWERMKIIVEPSSAVPLGALLAHRKALPGHRVGIILSGGNVDLSTLPWERKNRMMQG